MPIYEYQCQKCERTVEFIHGMNDKPPRAKCEECGGKLARIVSAAAFHLKGTGWYKTDYASSGSSSKESKSSASEASAGDTKKPDKPKKASNGSDDS